MALEIWKITNKDISFYRAFVTLLDLEMVQFQNSEPTKILVWKVRGTNKVGRMNVISKVAVHMNLDILMLSETRMDSKYVMYHWMPFEGVVYVEFDGQRRGMILIWNDVVDVTLVHQSP